MSHSQNSEKFSAVNPALFLYETQDVFINPPSKYNEGRNIIKPKPDEYPWEGRLENGMPNIMKDRNGNLAIYLSSFISFAEKPPSKVGMLVYTNNTNNIIQWRRPDAGLYWFNSSGKTAEEKISTTFKPGLKATNIVAVDVESVGIYHDTEKHVEKPIKLIYLPQRESKNKMIAAYEMNNTVDANGIFSDFAKMKNDRKEVQKRFTFKFINGDTHMNFLKQNGEYLFVSRLNAKRSFLREGEKLPFRPDNRARYRRETITKVGTNIVSKNVELNIALDMSSNQWEPYSMQPFKLTGFENDIWWGLVTMFGTENDPDVKYRQRTELAMSNNGINWCYLSPGTPFLDNGIDPKSDDYGCINIGKPIINTKFSSTSEMYYFYAASNERHVSGRNPGISLAIGKYGKLAGLKAASTEKQFYSISPVINPVKPTEMLFFSIHEAFKEGNEHVPYILADVTQDPREKTKEQITKWVSVSMYAYTPTEQFGKGIFLGGAYGSSKEGDTEISDEYERVPYLEKGINSTSKEHLFNYLRTYSTLHPEQVTSIKEFPPIAIVLECSMKNAVFYGIEYKYARDSESLLDVTKTNNFHDNGIWSYKPTTERCYTKDFSLTKILPNQKLPTQKETGSLAISVTPNTSQQEQCILRMHGSDQNYLGLFYNSNDGFSYRIVKDGINFSEIKIAPPSGQSFDGKKCIITMEAVKSSNRKYGKELSEESAILRVFSKSLNLSSVVQQPILWNWKHDIGHITSTDSANARGNAYLEYSAFVSNLHNITIGAEDSSCKKEFEGTIDIVEIADALPAGSSDFWDNTTITRSAVSHKDFTQITNQKSENTLSATFYPIPAHKNGILFLRIEQAQIGKGRMKLFDIGGRMVKAIVFNVNAPEQEIPIDITHLEKGIYVSVVELNNIIIQQKIIIQ